MLLTFTTGCLPSNSGGATSWRIRRQLHWALLPPLIDDFDDDFNINDFDIDLVPSSLQSASPTTIATVGRYNSRDLIFSFILSNMLICHTSMLYVLDLVHLFYMIYILVLIWKLSNYLPAACSMAWLHCSYIKETNIWIFAIICRNNSYALSVWHLYVSDSTG
jgi:hypothetical protein